MDSIQIQGQVALQGEVRIQGSKNAALPILAATLLVGEKTCLRNCPRISDVHAMLELLECLGCRINWLANGVEVDSGNITCKSMPSEAVRGMRSSLCLLGALLGRCGEVVMEYPGGCVIGERPIDLHLWGLKQLGVEFEEEGGALRAKATRLCGNMIELPFPSVGVTENLILTAVMAEGNTWLSGAAKEPEVQALCRFLCCCGAAIEGIGTDCLLIHGGRRLYGTDFKVPADRIVAGTYLFACIGTGGSVFLEEAPAKDMQTVLDVARQMGGGVFETREGIYVQSQCRPNPLELVTAPYPGFPTDLQSVVLAVETLGAGSSLIREKIFENRFRIVQELKKMGADIETVDAQSVTVRGVDCLRGASVEAKELRGGAALMVAGLMAGQSTLVSGVRYICRGYENICRDFRELGARVTSV